MVNKKYKLENRINLFRRSSARAVQCKGNAQNSGEKFRNYIVDKCEAGSPKNLVVRATSLRPWQPGNRCLNPGGSKRFSAVSRPAVGPTQVPESPTEESGRSVGLKLTDKFNHSWSSTFLHLPTHGVVLN